MRRVIVLTQVVDAEHPVLGATVAKIRALAASVDEVVVLALEPPRGDALAAELSPRPVAVLAHMAPVYALLAAPLCRLHRVPLLLWFTHWRASTQLRLAARLSTAVVTVDRRSFPFPSPKVVPIGHGIDL